MLIVERLVPDELYDLFQRVVPPAPTRPQGGGRRRHGDREVLAAIIFVATTGCTWRQLPPVPGPSGPTAPLHLEALARQVNVVSTSDRDHDLSRTQRLR
nr:transposase [Streptomyces colonosanans]